MRMTAEYFEIHGYENHPGNDQPDEVDLIQAEASLFEGKVMAGLNPRLFLSAPMRERLTCLGVRA